MMVEELNDTQAGDMSVADGKNKADHGSVNLTTFLRIMENSAW
jgi:hypothetical protein